MLDYPKHYKIIEYKIIYISTPENSSLGFSGTKILSTPPYVKLMKQLHNTN